MPDRAQFTTMAPRRVAAKPTFGMRQLQRLALWGAAAVVTLFIAVMAGRSEVGAQRIAGLLPSQRAAAPRSAHPNQAAPNPLDRESATQELVQTVRGLAEDRDRLMTRLSALERNLDDVTGSVRRQIEAAKTPPWPNSQALVPATPAALAALVAPVVPAPAALASPPTPQPPQPSPAGASGADAAPSAGPPAAYAIDLGSAASVAELHARWEAFRSARPKLFEGLRPLVSRKETIRSKRIEWRLVVGPLANLEAATRLCAALAIFRLFCQPAPFEGQHLAQR